MPFKKSILEKAWEVVEKLRKGEIATLKIPTGEEAVEGFLKWQNLKDVVKKGGPPVSGIVTASQLVEPEEAQAQQSDFIRPSEIEPTKPKSDWVSATQIDQPITQNWVSPSQIIPSVEETPPIPPSQVEIPKAGKPIPEFVRQAYKEATGEDAPITYPVSKRELPFWMDVALMVVAGGVGGTGVSTALARWAPQVGKLAAATLSSMGAGAAYEAARGAMGEPTEGLGVIGAPGEETLLWSGFPLAGRMVGKALKNLPKGVELITHKPIEAMRRVPGVEAAANWAWDNIIIQPTNVPLPGFKKSIREMFQPAVERLAVSKKLGERLAAGTIRKTEAMKSLVSEVGRDISKQLETLLPSEQYEFAKALRGVPLKDIKSPKAKELYQRMGSKIKEAALAPSYEVKFSEELAKGLTKPIEAIEGSVGADSIVNTLKGFEKGLTGKVSRWDMEKMMTEVIEHPNTTEEIKTLMKDLWSLSARTPLEVADAARLASTKYLTEKLIANKGLVSNVMKPGYEISKWGKFTDKYVPRDVELELQAISQIPIIARGMYQKWFLSPWKMSKTITRPAYHVRNLISNAILNDWGGLPFYRVDLYMDALKGMRNRSSEWIKFAQQTGAGGTFAQSDLYQLEGGLKYGASTWDKLYSVFEKVVAPGRGLQAAEENWFKFAKYLQNTKELKMKPAEAALDAMKWCFNYGEVTPEVAKIRKYAMPFATWYTKSLPLMAETAFKHPVRFWKWVLFGMYLQNEGLQAVGLRDSEWASIEKTLPEYLQKGIYLMMPWRDEQNRLNLLNLTYILPGIGDINELYNLVEHGLQVPNPLVSTLGAISTKRKFSGAPLYYDWESGSTKFSKTFAYVWEQLSPAIAPGPQILWEGVSSPTTGGTDWNLMWRSLTEQEGAPTPEQALASWFGFKLTPVDPAITARRAAAIQKIHESEMTIQMQKELRGARSGDETNRILEKYRKIRESIANP